LEVVDVVSGETVAVPDSQADFVGLEAFEGDYIVGLRSKVRPSPGEDATPGGNQNANRWQIVRYSLATGDSSVIDEGVNRWVIDDSYVHDPPISVDGDLIAYGKEVSRRPGAAEIILRNLVSGEMLRRISTTRPVFELQLVGQDITYVTGDLGDWPPWEGPENPERVHAPASGPAMVVPYDQDYDIVENGVTVWTELDGMDEEGRHLWVNATVGDNDRPIGIQNRFGAMVHGDGFVLWMADYSDGGAYMDTTGLTLFDTVTGQVVLVDQDVDEEREMGDVVGIDDGWLIWTTWDPTQAMNPDGSIPRTIHAMQTSDIRAALDQLGDL
jgi:hypothetical protein